MANGKSVGEIVMWIDERGAGGLLSARLRWGVFVKVPQHCVLVLDQVARQSPSKAARRRAHSCAVRFIHGLSDRYKFRLEYPSETEPYDAAKFRKALLAVRKSERMFIEAVDIVMALRNSFKNRRVYERA